MGGKGEEARMGRRGEGGDREGRGKGGRGFNMRSTIFTMAVLKLHS